MVDEKKEEVKTGTDMLRETLGKIKASEAGVKEVKEEPKKEEPAKKEVEEGVKKEEAKDDKKPEVVEKKEVIDKGKDNIPYARVAELSEKNKVLKSQLDAVQTQMAMMQQLIISKQGEVKKEDKKDIIELEAQELAEEQGLDIESARKLAKRMYSMIDKRNAETKKDTPAILVKTAISDALERYPRGKAYKDEVYDMVMKLKNPDHRTDPEVIIDAAKLIVVEKIDEIESAAEARAAKRQEANKKIVVSGIETPGGGDKKSAPELTDAQKMWADKYKIPYEKYAANLKRA